MQVLVGKYAIEKWAKIAVDVELASEYRYREPAVTKRTLLIPISQSGETMDTLMAVRYARENKASGGFYLQYARCHNCA